VITRLLAEEGGLEGIILGIREERLLEGKRQGMRSKKD